MPKLNQKGFSLIEGLLIVIALVLIIFVGYYVWHTQKEANKTLDSSSKTSQKSSQSSDKKEKDVDPVLFKDNGTVVYALSGLAKTSDQKGVSATLDEQCNKSGTDYSYQTASHTFVAATTVEDIFSADSSSQNYLKVGDFVRINVGCYDKSATGEQLDGGAANFLRKVSGKWKYLTATQMEPNCSYFDGTGVPAAILNTCTDAETGASRAPKP